MKINWRDHLVNLVVVILGITIAFWVNSWGESRKMGKLENQYLEGIIKDIEGDIVELEAIIKYNEDQISSLERIINFITQTTEASDTLTSDLYNIQFNLPFTPQNATFQSLSGKIEVISDFDIRNQIIQYYNQDYTSMKLWDDSCKETIDTFFKPVVFKELTYVTPGKIDYSFFQLRELQNSIFAMRFLFGQRLNYVHGFSKDASELKATIETYRKSL